MVQNGETGQRDFDDNPLKYYLLEVRLKRDDILKRTDKWFFEGDGAFTEEQKTYRQTLRDIPQNYTTLEQIDPTVAGSILERDENSKLKHSVWSMS